MSAAFSPTMIEGACKFHPSAVSALRSRRGFLAGSAAVIGTGMLPAAWAQTYDINTLAGKVASVNGTAGLQIRFSAFIEEESHDSSAPLMSDAGGLCLAGTNNGCHATVLYSKSTNGGATFCGPTATTSKRSCGSTARSSFRRRSIRRTSPPRLPPSETLSSLLIGKRGHVPRFPFELCNGRLIDHP